MRKLSVLVVAFAIGVPVGCLAVAGASGSPRVYVNFGEKAQYRPKTLYLGNQPIVEIEWESWGEPTAVGTGVFPANDCLPNCARGHITNDPVSLKLDRIHTCHGKRLYSRVRYELPPSAPGASRQSLSVNCAGRFSS
jgi:hypothetical protein